MATRKPFRSAPPQLKEQHYLTALFEPASVAIIGASERPNSVGAILVRNMQEAGYRGALFAINPAHERIGDLPTYASIEDVPQRVDLVVIATRAATVPGIMEACGRAGVRAAVVISAGFSESGPAGAELERVVVTIARQHHIRLIGPNCLGIMRPDINLNATFARGNANPGSIGLISQSGAVCAAMLDWARPNNVGFSSVISIGSSSDVDFGEILDFLIADPKTENIFLYIEGIRNARSFMSALRAAARVKPVLLIKVGRYLAGSRAAQSHTGSLVGADDVFDAALRRAGVVRLQTLGQMLATARALFSHFRPRGNRLAIITNGGGPGAMAADRAASLDIPLAALSTHTIDILNQTMLPNWSHGNPIDIVGDAGTEHYRAALAACLADEHVDGILVLLAPQAMTDAFDVANAVVATLGLAQKPVVTCWMGEEQVESSRRLFEQAGVPTFRTPEPAVELFAQISAYYRNQQLLMQTPPSIAHPVQPRLDEARTIIESALAEQRTVLNELEAKALLAAFHIPISKTGIAHTPAEARALAEQFGLPVAMKIASPDIIHKTDSGGVRLNLRSLQSVHDAWQEIQNEVRLNRPDAVIHGVSIEAMVSKANGRELMVGVTRDETFGPTIVFGAGGPAVEVHRDRAVALPPLNHFLAADMIRSTRVFRLLGEFRHMPPVDMAAIETILLRVSEMVCELPWIRELDINPLIVDEHGAVAVDARIVVENLPPGLERYGHMAIHPYPSHLVAQLVLRDGTHVTLRPLRPEDAELEQEFVRDLSAESKYFRFMNTVRELTQSMLARLTQIDYDRDMAFIVVRQNNGVEEELGVCRYATNPDGVSCEFALVVADAWQNHGVGRHLMTTLIEVARAKGLKYMVGQILSQNDRMLAFVAGLGFVLSGSPDDPGVKRAVLQLQVPPL